MTELLEFDQVTRKIHLDPVEIAEVLPDNRNSDWTILVMKSRKEHSVLGHAADLAKVINSARGKKA
jgi:hypothetical protein